MKLVNKGISIIEIVIASAIIAVSVIGIITALQAFLVISLDNTDRAQVALMLEESVEVTQYIRDTGWTENIETLSDTTPYYIVWNGLDYSLTDSPQVEKGKFTRKLLFEKVYRDSGDDISESGTLDTGTRKVFVSIDWTNSKGTQNVNSEFLIHDVYQN